MRALISLYHQAESFITPETLSERIDDAFVHYSRHPIQAPVSVRELESALTDRRNAPRISQWDQDVVGPGGYDTGGWSSIRAAREQKVIEALYGVNFTNDRVLPGLEALEESTEQVQSSIREELEEQENSEDHS
jgi:hypothetical protein